MALFIFVIIPIGWAITGRLLGPAIYLTVPTERSQRRGTFLAHWCTWLLPAVHYALYFLGGDGNAGYGFQLFGSEELFVLSCLPVFTVPVLGIYVVVLYVVRNLVRGLRSRV